MTTMFLLRRPMDGLRSAARGQAVLPQVLAPVGSMGHATRGSSRVSSGAGAREQNVFVGRVENGTQPVATYATSSEGCWGNTVNSRSYPLLERHEMARCSTLRWTNLTALPVDLPLFDHWYRSIVMD